MRMYYLRRAHASQKSNMDDRAVWIVRITCTSVPRVEEIRQVAHDPINPIRAASCTEYLREFDLPHDIGFGSLPHHRFHFRQDGAAGNILSIWRHASSSQYWVDVLAPNASVKIGDEAVNCVCTKPIRSGTEFEILGVKFKVEFITVEAAAGAAAGAGDAMQCHAQVTCESLSLLETRYHSANDLMFPGRSDVTIRPHTSSHCIRFGWPSVYEYSFGQDREGDRREIVCLERGVRSGDWKLIVHDTNAHVIVEGVPRYTRCVIDIDAQRGVRFSILACVFVARFWTTPAAAAPLPETGAAAGGAAGSARKRRAVSEPEPAPEPEPEPAEVAACVVCLTAMPTHLFMPCMHACTCAACNVRIVPTRRCPYCQGFIEQNRRIYISCRDGAGRAGPAGGAARK